MTNPPPHVYEPGNNVIVTTSRGPVSGVVLAASARAVTVSINLTGGGIGVDTVTPDRVQLDPAYPVTVWLNIDTNAPDDRDEQPPEQTDQGGPS